MSFSREYMEIVAVVPKPDGLDFLFGNGDVSHLRLEELMLMVPQKYQEVNWDRAEVLDYRSAVSVPAVPEPLIVSVVKIRERTDPKFATHLQSVAMRQCAFIGRKLRTLRESVNLSVEQAAGKARITPILYSDIEDGHPVLYDYLNVILDALNKDWSDLAGDA